jgi:hypothetical protein
MTSPDMPLHAYILTPVNVSMKILGNCTMVLPDYLVGIQKLVTVYDCSGKLLYKAIVKKNAINLQKDFGMSNGLYMMRVKGTTAAEKL